MTRFYNSVTKQDSFLSGSHSEDKSTNGKTLGRVVIISSGIIVIITIVINIVVTRKSRGKQY